MGDVVLEYQVPFILIKIWFRTLAFFCLACNLSLWYLLAAPSRDSSGVEHTPAMRDKGGVTQHNSIQLSRDSSGVEHTHGKGGVVSSNLILGSICMRFIFPLDLEPVRS